MKDAHCDTFDAHPVATRCKLPWLYGVNVLPQSVVAKEFGELHAKHVLVRASDLMRRWYAKRQDRELKYGSGDAIGPPLAVVDCVDAEVVIMMRHERQTRPRMQLDLAEGTHDGTRHVDIVYFSGANEDVTLSDMLSDPNVTCDTVIVLPVTHAQELVDWCGANKKYVHTGHQIGDDGPLCVQIRCN